jgi:hypothetical protein
VNEARPNKFDAWCSLCRLALKVGEGLVTQREVPKEDGTTEKKWITDCKDVEACHERIRAANRKRSAAAKARKPAAREPWFDVTQNRWRTK